MKICLISLDYWGYDVHIVNALNRKGIDANHIDTSKFKYKYRSFFEKTINFFLKFFFKKNIKKIKKEEFILQSLIDLGHQDIILVIRPDLIRLEIHSEIKKLGDKYITYLYDSCIRFPIDNLLTGIFDKIYSFDIADVKKYGFDHITNYIYHEKQPIESNFMYDVFIVLSPDNRVELLNKIACQLEALQINYKFIVVGPKKPENLHSGIIYSDKAVGSEELKEFLSESKVLLDLTREGHNGLSFRVFEALAYQKKIITTNKTVTNYSFYKPNNIAVLDPEFPKIKKMFFDSSYESLLDNEYNQFTVENFVDTIFELK